MNRIFIILIASLGFISCDDGDIIVTGFEFDDATLELCEGSGTDEYVYFKINSSINEAIALRFTQANFTETPNPLPTTPITFTLDETNNSLIYRQFNNSITNDYFCSNVPPNGIVVTQELISTQGNVTIETTIANEDDNDGIPAEDEDINGDGNLENDDTDNDNIPNYKDQDDDGDNILTSNELANGIPGDDTPRDTDGDGIPDYLEEDDDNDMILTRNEDSSGTQNPRDPSNDSDNDGILDYLDNDSSPSPAVTVSSITANTIRTTYRTSIIITELEFNATTADFNQSTFSLGSRDITIDIDN